MADSQNNQPTILVKKADGSSVKVTMAEFIKMKEKKVADSKPVKSSPTPVASPVVSDSSKSSSLPPSNNEEAKKKFEDLKKKLNITNERIENSKKINEIKPEIKKPIAPVIKDTSFIDNLKGAFREDSVGVKKNENVNVKKDKDFGRSLMEEKIDSKVPDVPKTSADRIDQVDEIIKKLSFSTTSDNQNRLRTIIQLNLKDIRSEDQTREVLERPIIEGGLELKPSQADELMGKLLVEHEKLVPVQDTEDLPTVYKEPPVPAVGTPFNSFVHSSKAGVNATAKKINDFKEDKLDQLIRQRREKKAIVPSKPILPPKPIVEIKESSVKENVSANNIVSNSIKPVNETKETVVNKIIQAEPSHDFKLNTQASVKKIMHDVSPPSVNEKLVSADNTEIDITDQEYGPVGEILHFSLIDFRRLSSNPTEAAARLAQKMFNLRDESYLMYIKTLDAWEKSPLHLVYMQTIDKSLADRKSIKDVVSQNPESINLNEITALVKMEETL